MHRVHIHIPDALLLQPCAQLAREQQIGEFRLAVPLPRGVLGLVADVVEQDALLGRELVRGRGQADDARRGALLDQRQQLYEQSDISTESTLNLHTN